jgi:hypothetical protein
MVRRRYLQNELVGGRRSRQAGPVNPFAKGSMQNAAKLATYESLPRRYPSFR